MTVFKIKTNRLYTYDYNFPLTNFAIFAEFRNCIKLGTFI